MSAGRVCNHAGLALPRSHYDLAVIGAGVLGLCCAYFLRRLAPELSLVVIEADGIPSEGGATQVSPGVVTSVHPEKEQRLRAGWARDLLLDLPEQVAGGRGVTRTFFQTGILDLEPDLAGDSSSPPTGLWRPDAFLNELSPAKRDLLTRLVDFHGVERVRFDPEGGYAHAESVALAFGHGAVRAGADLVLNTRLARLDGETLYLERLEFDRSMTRKVVSRLPLTATRTVLAAGPVGSVLIEESSGELLPRKRAYMQYPRLERLPVPSEAGPNAFPVVREGSFLLRPQGEGALCAAACLPPDPEGYEPREGSLMGVKVGLRRELIASLLAKVERFPCLASPRLNLGKTVSQLRGAWDVVAERPTWTKPARSDHYLLTGGGHGLSLGLASAYDLAATLAGVAERPWLRSE